MVKSQGDDIVTRRQGVLQRGIAVLRCFQQAEGQALTLAEISRSTGLDKSTAHRLLKVFVEERFLRYSPEEQNYRLHVGLMELVGISARQHQLRMIAQRHLRKLQRELQESVGIHVRIGDFRICIEEVESELPLRMSSRVGHPYPVWAGAAGLALVAHMDREQQEAVVRSALEHEPGSLDAGDYLALLDRVARQGYACTSGATTPGAVGLAAPVRDYSGLVVASLNVAGPEVRFSPQDDAALITTVKTTAEDISRDLGWREEPNGQAPAGEGSLRAARRRSTS